MGTLNRITVVGASLAGLRAVQTLRREGFDGEVTLVGAEFHVPYNRPPLSKSVLHALTSSEPPPEQHAQRGRADPEQRGGRAGRFAIASCPRRIGSRPDLDG
ncbi:FAD-dependent oxidoreductase [Nonomuraea sp. NPDC049784]|uniref:FAD-dependent oxidoreductase n=1 Tax=Nonomuraea sp. NPDC049784 TaxID=3154361 RepID=UPI0033FDDE92